MLLEERYQSVPAGYSCNSNIDLLEISSSSDPLWKRDFPVIHHQWFGSEISSLLSSVNEFWSISVAIGQPSACGVHVECGSSHYTQNANILQKPTNCPFIRVDALRWTNTTWTYRGIICTDPRAEMGLHTAFKTGSVSFSQGNDVERKRWIWKTSDMASCLDIPPPLDLEMSCWRLTHWDLICNYRCPLL